jgi:hypothetical protein
LVWCAGPELLACLWRAEKSLLLNKLIDASWSWPLPADCPQKACQEEWSQSAKNLMIQPLLNNKYAILCLFLLMSTKNWIVDCYFIALG